MYAFIALSFIVHLTLVARARAETRAFLSVLAFTHFYFCIAGLWFWLDYMEGYFVGFYWDTDLVLRSAMILSLSTGGLALFVYLFDSGVTRAPLRAVAREPVAVPVVRSTWVLLGLGGLASLFVLLQGSFNEYYDQDNRGAFFLIAYQFADLLIPVVLFLVAKQGFTSRNVILLLYFVFFAVLVGFRYKLALLFLPIIVQHMLAPVPVSRKLTRIAPLGLGVLALFSVMTLYRSKFGLPDLSKPLEDPFSDLLYGLFAEANILFGFTAALRVFVDQGYMIYFQPVIDSFKDYIPRALWPSRETGLYLMRYGDGFVTPEGADSKTTYPWIAEFGLMFGWFGIVLGVLLYGSLFVWLHKMVVKYSVTRRLRTFGVGLMIAVIAYYHYTRGYIPQATKIYVFVVAPYIFLCWRDLKLRQRVVSMGATAIRAARPRLRQAPA